MNRTILILAITCGLLAGCDDFRNAAEQSERADRAYRTAMDDYRAGRIAQALEGFKKTCAAAPGNASARFQLACLLQDHAKDYVGAFCAFREYLLQRPESEKAKLAKDRMNACEREMAKSLAERFAPKAVQDALRNAQEVRAAQSKLEAERAKLKAELDATAQSLARLRQENDRLKKLMRDEVDSETATQDLTQELLEAKMLKSEAPKEIAEAGGAATDEIAAAKSLVAKDVANAEPPPMLPQAADAKEKRAAAIAAEKKAKMQPAAPLYPHEKRPETYVVQEGDTLYKLAVRFYGRRSAWERIRDANKAEISMDGRIRAGQKLVLPAGE